MQSRSGLRALSRRQLGLLAGAVALNFVLLLGLVALLASPAPEPLPIASDAAKDAACEAAAALGLRQSGVAASVVITNEALFVSVIEPDAAAAWDVFSVTARLHQAGCGPYNLIRVDVPDPEGRADLRLVLELTGLEVQYWADGRLSDVQLAEGMRRQLFQAPP